MNDKRPAIFFDRDGVINIDVHYLFKIADFKWIDGAIESIRYANKYGYWVFVITNQSGIARGYYQEKDVIKLHMWMNEELKRYNAHIDDFFYCPHHEKGIVEKYSIKCNCRKPKSGLIEDAMNNYEIDKSKSIMFGDKDSDIECANNAGIYGVKFTGKNLYDVVRKYVLV